MDLNHGLLFENPARIWDGDYDDCSDADIVVLAAGAKQFPRETRMDLLNRNVSIFREIFSCLATDSIASDKEQPALLRRSFTF